MSQENVEKVRAGFAAYNRGDLDALLEAYDPEVEFVTLMLGNHRGKEALLGLYEENRKAVLGYKLEPEELIDAGDKVIALARIGGAGRVSQIALDDLIAFVFTIKDGLITRQQTLRNKEEALEAAGLAERAMSQENVKKVTRDDAEILVAALNARDFAAIEAIPIWHPQVEFHSALAAAEGDVYRGICGLRQWAEAVDETWADFRLVIVDFRAVSHDEFVVMYQITGCARASGVPLDTQTAQVWSVRDGKLWRNVSYTDPREALEAVGLRE